MKLIFGTTNKRKKEDLQNTSEFSRGTLYNQLVDAYSFNDEIKEVWDAF